jgi:hypothetical protein
VKQREDADVTIEVVGRVQDRHDSDIRTVHFHVRAGDYAFDSDGINDDGHWGGAAYDGWRKIADWIDKNRAALLAKRRPRKDDEKGGA